MTIDQHGTAGTVGGVAVQFDVVFTEPVVGFTSLAAADFDFTGTNASSRPLRSSASAARGRRMWSP